MMMAENVELERLRALVTAGHNAAAAATAKADRFEGTLRYILQQAKTRPSGDALTLSVIERNARAALDDGFQAAVASAITKAEA